MISQVCLLSMNKLRCGLKVHDALNSGLSCIIYTA
jgi:hypothetical protein